MRRGGVSLGVPGIGAGWAMSLEPTGLAVSRNQPKKQESSVHTPPHTRRIHVCVHVLYVCMYSMYVLYVCTLCMCRERAFQQIAEAAVRAVWAHERVAPTPIAASSSSFSGPAPTPITTMWMLAMGM